MLELLSEKHKLRLVLHSKHVILRLKSLVELVEACHFPDEGLTRREMRLLRLVLLQSRLVHI